MSGRSERDHKGTLVIVLGALGMFAAGCEPEGTGRASTQAPSRVPTPDASTSVAATPKGIAILTSEGFGPISYFQDRCANCHGNFGDQLLPTMRSASDEAYLHEQNRAMVIGPAQSSLTDRELTLLSAYVRSIFDQRPFAIVTSAQGSILTGEASPNATITLAQNDLRTQAQRDGVTWRVELSDGASGDRVVLQTTDPAGTHSDCDLHASPFTTTRR